MVDEIAEIYNIYFSLPHVTYQRARTTNGEIGPVKIVKREIV